jgi:hypothetical protein
MQGVIHVTPRDLYPRSDQQVNTEGWTRLFPSYMELRRVSARVPGLVVVRYEVSRLGAINSAESMPFPVKMVPWLHMPYRNPPLFLYSELPALILRRWICLIKSFSLEFFYNYGLENETYYIAAIYKKFPHSPHALVRGIIV